MQKTSVQVALKFKKLNLIVERILWKEKTEQGKNVLLCLQCEKTGKSKG